jgi:hypothetical protein
VLLRDHEREVTSEHEQVAERASSPPATVSPAATATEATVPPAAPEAPVPPAASASPATDTAPPTAASPSHAASPSPASERAAAPSKPVKPGAANAGSAKSDATKPDVTKRDTDRSSPPHGEPAKRVDSNRTDDEQLASSRPNEPLIKSQLDEAERDLDSGDNRLLPKARAIANRALANPDASVGQKARAHMLIAIVACRTSRQEEAITAYRQIMRYPKLRNRVQAQCNEAGYDMRSVE